MKEIKVPDSNGWETKAIINRSGRMKIQQWSEELEELRNVTLKPEQSQMIFEAYFEEVGEE